MIFTANSPNNGMPKDYSVVTYLHEMGPGRREIVMLGLIDFMLTYVTHSASGGNMKELTRMLQALLQDQSITNVNMV